MQRESVRFSLTLRQQWLCSKLSQTVLEIRRLTDQDAGSYQQLWLEAWGGSRKLSPNLPRSTSFFLETIRNRLGSVFSVKWQGLSQPDREIEARSGACTSQRSAERKASAEPWWES